MKPAKSRIHAKLSSISKNVEKLIMKDPRLNKK